MSTNVPSFFVTLVKPGGAEELDEEYELLDDRDLDLDLFTAASAGAELLAAAVGSAFAAHSTVS